MRGVVIALHNCGSRQQQPSRILSSKNQHAALWIEWQQYGFNRLNVGAAAAAAAAVSSIIQHNFSTLSPPSIVFSNHHLLVVNKPAGWHSIPLDEQNNVDDDNNKCLLTYLRQQRLGGGSRQDYLKPVHRLDQPCTGIVVWAKNTKAASRIQRAWAKRQVHKEYYCVVRGSLSTLKRRAIIEWDGHLPQQEVMMEKSPPPFPIPSLSWGDNKWDDPQNVLVLAGRIRKRIDGKGSVHVEPIRNVEELVVVDHDKAMGDHASDQKQINEGRFCFLQVRHVGSLTRGTNASSSSSPSSSSSLLLKDNNNVVGKERSTLDDSNPSESNNLQLLAVRTNTGFRHQIRALLAVVGGCPVVGDLRYGSSSSNNNNDNSNNNDPLPDQSVALHARALYMPTVQLGGIDLKSQPFVAPIPGTWNEYFALTEQQLRGGKD
jgi:23S rRNA-/tRNA-specific pseudouridylate synthase